ncbi:MAG: hypothetical protein ACO388_00485 [Saprospiraceae bacterium]
MRKEAQVIKAEPFDHSDLNYDVLLEKGLEWVQRYSGDHWTDYNYHDPGVTFLEQIVYALTDLGYRTSFDIHDLLMVGKDNFPLFEKNLFFPPQEILPVNPVNVSDFRKLIIDRVKEIDNAWIIAVKDDPSGFKGLYNILLQCSEDLSEGQKFKVLDLVNSLFQEHRNLCQDLKSIKILTPESITFSGKIILKSDAIGEQVFASILNAVDGYLAPAIKFYHPEDLLKEGYTMDKIYDGPQPIYGYLEPSELPERKDLIFTATIKEIILNIEGVQDLRDFTLYKNGIKLFEDSLTFEEGLYPVLGSLQSFFENANDRLDFYKDQVRYMVDHIAVTQLYESLASGRKNSYLNAIKYKNEMAQGHFTYKELSTFYSIQQELPELYGLKAESLPSNVAPRRRAQVKQLKAYLSIFDQIMANYLSQLANTRKLFSIEKDIDRTYFSQYPSDIPDMDQITIEENPDQYLKNLQEITESKENFWKRRNKVLDHLLARFGERFIPIPGMNPEDIIRAKIKFLENYIVLSRDRGKGYHYQIEEDLPTNISGLEKKLTLALDLNINNASLIEPLLEFGKIENEPERIKNWQKKTITSKDGKNINVWKLPEDEYENDSLSFYTQADNFIKQLFLFGIQDRYYRIVETQDDQTKWHILYTGFDFEIPTVVTVSNELDLAKQTIVNSIKKFEELNKACEGIHLLEHILLRPMESIKYSYTLFDKEGGTLITSFYQTDLKEQKKLIDDIFYLGVQRDNYGIVELKEKNLFEIILYGSENEMIGRFEKTFYSRIGAEKEVERAIALFEEIKEGNFGKEEAIEINQVSGMSHTFPATFGFEDEYSIILPNWPAKFQNDDFKNLLVSQIAENSPLHLKVNLYFIGIKKMMEFEDVFFEWKNIKRANPPDPIVLDSASLRLVQTLQGMNAFKLVI